MAWTLAKADSEFSIFIRKRDGRCMNPRCSRGLQYGAEISQLDCSHYHDRGVWLTRFSPINCIALCRRCHQLWEDEKEKAYRDLMIRIIGWEPFYDMEKRVRDYKFKNIPHLDREEEIEKCRLFLTKK